MALILIVDDDETILTATSRLIQNTGHRVKAFASGSGTLDHATCPDLVVLDVQMPGMTGPETARKLRARWPDVPLLFVTGSCSPEQLAETTALGPVLKKPCRPEQLMAVISEMIDEHTAEPI